MSSGQQGARTGWLAGREAAGVDDQALKTSSAFKTSAFEKEAAVVEKDGQSQAWSTRQVQLPRVRDDQDRAQVQRSQSDA